MDAFCDFLSFFLGDCWATSNEMRISRSDFRYMYASEAFHYHCKGRGQGLDTIHIVIACTFFSAEGIDQVFIMTILVGFNFASCENANLFCYWFPSSLSTHSFCTTGVIVHFRVRILHSKGTK